MFIPVTRYVGDDVNSLISEGEFVINTKYIQHIKKINNNFYFINLNTGNSDRFDLYVTSDDANKIVNSMNYIITIDEDDLTDETELN